MPERDFNTFPAFSAALLNTVSVGIAVVDGERRLRLINHAFARALGVSESEVIGQRPGAVLRCVESLADPARCGLESACESCTGRNLALATLRSGEPQRALVGLQLVVDGQLRDLEVRVTAAPFEVEGEPFAILVVEDLAPLRAASVPGDATARFGIVGRDPAIIELQRTIQQVAKSNAPVLIQGESGTGKELVATAIHKESGRNEGLFVPVNCGALSEGLLESELFGHVKGAFTGALREKKGRFQLADGGSLFLDEVGELTPSMQVRFLRVLQTGRFEPVGSERSLEVDVRIICATNRDLRTEVAKGRFREDLFYRLNVFPLRVPPLRARQDDIPELAAHLLAAAALEDGFASVPTIEEGAMRRLREHAWPGNVRELENVLRFALIRAGGNRITAQHLPPILNASGVASLVTASAGSRTGLAPDTVAIALRETGGNKVKAAKALGVSRATLYRFLDEHDLPGFEVASREEPA